jgi:hypothetical protein
MLRERIERAAANIISGPPGSKLFRKVETLLPSPGTMSYHWEAGAVESKELFQKRNREGCCRGDTEGSGIREVNRNFIPLGASKYRLRCPRRFKARGGRIGRLQGGSAREKAVRRLRQSGLNAGGGQS